MDNQQEPASITTTQLGSDLVRLSLDDGSTWEPFRVLITGQTVDGVQLTGVNFQCDTSLESLVDSPTTIVISAPAISDEPLIGQLHRQGPDYLLILAQ